MLSMRCKPAVLLVAALSLVACSGSALAKTSPPSKARSHYTAISLKSCAKLPPRAPTEGGGMRCKGPAGYQIVTRLSDERGSIAIVTPDGKEHEQEYWTHITKLFSALGDKAEWRVRTVKGKPQPHALIMRVTTAKDADRPAEMVSYLGVSKISASGICLTDIVKSGRNANQRARQLADVAEGKPCIQPKNE